MEPRHAKTMLVKSRALQFQFGLETGRLRTYVLDGETQFAAVELRLQMLK